MKKLLLQLVAITFLVSVFSACNETYDSPIDPIDSQLKSGLNTAIEKIQDVMDLQDKVTDALFNNPEVVGTGTGLDENGNPAIVVYTISKVQQRADVNVQNIGKGAHPTALPVSIENVPVVPKVTGMFKAYADPTEKFPRPVPIGVSTGHPDITAGTIGCRVKDASGNVYALSNNHVFANINKASIGDNILQPGPYDGGQDPADAIGTLHDYETMVFNGGANYIDAAIAICAETELGYSTPSGDGYGTPSSTVVSASVGQKVQKYGRTTVWTMGEVSEINVTVNVCYETAGPFNCKTYATFVDQISISPGSFSSGGDSGSLIVTDDGKNYPVGLLFAGSDTRTLANPIQLVLDRFNVTIDDGSGGETSNSAPTADFTFTTTDLTANFNDQSTDSDGEIASWSWVFGDGATSTAQNPSHTYAADGTYTVSLTVTDDDGATGTTSQDVTVSGSTTTNEPPTADFTYTTSELTAYFTDTSTDDGEIASWSWDFGDGAASTAQNPSHTYGSDGTYTVSLTVTDGDGESDSASKSITVAESTGDGIILTATGNKVRGRHNIDLTWSGNNSNVDIYRDGTKIETNIGGSSYTDNTENVGGGSYTYQVCETGTSTCSNEVTVTF